MFKESDKITEEALKGGFKADAGKPRMGLIPPDVLIEVAKLYTMGAAKYSDDNWKLGMDYYRVYDAMQRHANYFWAGEERDPIDGQHHLDSVIWCAMTLRYYQLHEEQYKEFDSRKKAPVRAKNAGQK